MSQLSWTPRDAPEFTSKSRLQSFHLGKISEFFDNAALGGTLKQKDLRLLLMFLARDAGDCSWPFANDSIETIDALRAALQTAPEFKLDLDLESAGLGQWFIPDDVLVLMRNEGIGLKEAAARVLGADCASICGCGQPIPVPWVVRSQ